MTSDALRTQRSGHSADWLALAQAGVAALTLELAAGDGTWRARLMGLATVALLAVGLFIARRVFGRTLDGKAAATDDVPASAAADRSPRRLLIVLCSLWTLPFLLDATRLSELIGERQPLEVQLLAGLRNASLGLAILGSGRKLQQVTCAISMFLALFASAISSDPWVHVLVALFTVAGLFWLMSTYWESLRDRLPGQTARRLPRRALLVVPLIVAGLVVVVPVAGHYSTTALPGFMPSSGGTQSYDPSARGGINDGDALVAATDSAHSFGPVESDIFLDSEQPSLYDVMNELYGDPPKSKTDKAVSLTPEFLRVVEQRIAKAEKAGREFSSVRQPRPRDSQKMADRRSRALLHVSGRVPLHLRLQTYDLFDGVTWHAEPEMDPPLTVRMKTVRDKPWVELHATRAVDVFTGGESHALKIVRLDTNRIPAPLHATGIHIDRVDRPDMFVWAEPSILRMDRDQLPGMIVIHELSMVQDPKKLQNLRYFVGQSKSPHLAVPTDDETKEVAALAKTWTGGTRTDWEKVERIVERLREQCVLDADAQSTPDCPNTVAEFLLKTRRGTDYHFASAAAVMLRTLGCSTRVVSGFYADPQRYDARSRLTPVEPEDVHFWVEVYIGAGAWATVEPTPGYEVLSPPPTLWERASAALLAGWRLAADRPATSLAIFALAILAWRRRIALCDAILTLTWWISSRSTLERSVLSTLQLLERRLSWEGLPRPAAVTPSRHLEMTLLSSGRGDVRQLREFVRLVDRALYAPAGRHDAHGQTQSAPSVCRDMIRMWNRQAIRAADTKKVAGAPRVPSALHSGAVSNRRTAQGTVPATFVDPSPLSLSRSDVR